MINRPFFEIYVSNTIDLCKKTCLVERNLSILLFLTMQYSQKSYYVIFIYMYMLDNVVVLVFLVVLDSVVQDILK